LNKISQLSLLRRLESLQNKKENNKLSRFSNRKQMNREKSNRRRIMTKRKTRLKLSTTTMNVISLSLTQRRDLLKDGSILMIQVSLLFCQESFKANLEMDLAVKMPIY
jgi:hypothetical protein